MRCLFYDLGIKFYDLRIFYSKISFYFYWEMEILCRCTDYQTIYIYPDLTL